MTNVVSQACMTMEVDQGPKEQFCEECGKDIRMTHWDRMCITCDKRQEKKAEAHIDGQGMELEAKEEPKPECNERVAARKRKPEEDLKETIDPEADEETEDERDEEDEKPKKSAKRQKTSKPEDEKKAKRKLAEKVEVALVSGSLPAEWKTEPLKNGDEDYQFVVTNRGVVHASEGYGWGGVTTPVEFPKSVTVYPKKENLANVEKIKKLLAAGHTVKAFKRVEPRGIWKLNLRFGRVLDEEVKYEPKFLAREERLRKKHEEEKRWQDFGEKLRAKFAEDHSGEATTFMETEMFGLMTDADRTKLLAKKQEAVNRAVRAVLVDELQNHRSW